MDEPKLRSTGWIALLSLPLTMTSGFSQAQDDLLDFEDEVLLFEDITTVYAASKYEQKVTDAPASISIVTADEIAAYGYRTLSDVLQSLRALWRIWPKTPRDPARPGGFLAPRLSPRVRRRRRPLLAHRKMGYLSSPALLARRQEA